MYVALIIIFNGYETHAVLSYTFCITNKFISFTAAYTVHKVTTKISIYELPIRTDTKSIYLLISFKIFLKYIFYIHLLILYF